MVVRVKLHIVESLLPAFLPYRKRKHSRSCDITTELHPVSVRKLYCHGGNILLSVTVAALRGTRYSFSQERESALLLFCIVDPEP